MHKKFASTFICNLLHLLLSIFSSRLLRVRMIKRFFIFHVHGGQNSRDQYLKNYLYRDVFNKTRNIFLLKNVLIRAGKYYISYTSIMIKMPKYANFSQASAIPLTDIRDKIQILSVNS